MFLFYKGHSNSRNGILESINSWGDEIEFEAFLRDVALLRNVFVIGIFDSCRRDRGRGGIYTKLEDT